MLISGLSVFFIYLLDNKTQSLIMSCVFSAISVIGWNSLDVLQAELFPTNLRSDYCSHDTHFLSQVNSIRHRDELLKPPEC